MEPISLVSTCELKDGTAAATIEVSVEVPATGEAGRPVQPGPATVTLTLSRADLAGLLPAGTEAVVSRAALKVKVAQKDDSAEAQWELSSPGTPLPADGEVRLVHSGEVPYVTFGAPGEVGFSLEELTLELISASATAEGTPDIATLTCRPQEGRSGHFATTQVTAVPDTGPSGTPGASAAPADGSGEAAEKAIAVEPPATPVEGGDPCPLEPPVGELDTSEALQPPEGGPLKVSPLLPGTFGCAYALGLANVRKLNGAMIINDPGQHPALLSVLVGKQTSSRSNNAPGGYYMRTDSIANLKLPDAESTFMAFGFQPVTARVSFENGPMTISVADVGRGPDRVTVATAYFRQSLRLHDVKVNGTPLDVGSNCGTSKSFKVVLKGVGTYRNALVGGPLNGEVDIPAFSGCGTGGEDLNPLFTASLSGPGNRVFLNQGTVCVPSQSDGLCPPTMPALPGAKTP
ncbi:DUF6801 domain-containing protein [Streptomyces sp. NPDC050149]|uniref:DUF6801 domain-containing protein n=1 Tax=Streptomyces sp. NPDC050149 TaxID=3365603 RepID=UPI0037A1476D